MNTEADVSPRPAIETRPNLEWNRRLPRAGNPHGLLVAGASVLVIGIGMTWYLGRERASEQVVRAGSNAATAELILPPLRSAPPNPEPVPSPIVPLTQESGGGTSEGDWGADRLPAPTARYAIQRSVASNVSTGTMASPATAPDQGDSSPVLWRQRTEPPGPSPDVQSRLDATPVNASQSTVAPGYHPLTVRRLPTTNAVLTKGTVVRCTLETAIDSELAGLVTCVTGGDVYGGDGRQVLLARGTRLLGEAHSDLHAGRSRVLVMWVEARTPDGLLVPIVSPATDALGRAGVPGEVDTHFLDRFGAAMLISAIDAGVQGLANHHADGAVVVSTQSGDAVVTEVLRNTVSIPPTVRVPPGTALTVLVTQDVDFGPVLGPAGP